MLATATLGADAGVLVPLPPLGVQGAFILLREIGPELGLYIRCSLFLGKYS